MRLMGFAGAGGGVSSLVESLSSVNAPAFLFLDLPEAGTGVDDLGRAAEPPALGLEAAFPLWVCTKIRARSASDRSRRVEGAATDLLLNPPPSNWCTQPASMAHSMPFPMTTTPPSVTLFRSTLMKHLFRLRLCRIEFIHPASPLR